MDPEVTRELEEQLRTLNEMISQQTAALTGMSKAINDSSVAVQNAGANANQLTKAQRANEQGSTQNTNATTALQKTHEKYGEVMQTVMDNFSSAYRTGSTAVVGFTKTLLGSEEGFAKYNSTIGGLGDAAFSLGKNFGIIGFILGGLFKVGSEVLQYQTKQADGLLNASDAMARMGAAGTLTTEEIRQMGRGAGLTSLELEKLTKPMQSVQGGFVALGGTTSEGIKKFGQMTAVSEDVRREFKRLGMGDQERNQALADFVTMMNKSGTAVSGDLATQGGLQKAALAYTRNLYQLAEMTGKDVETAKREREMQMGTMEVALQKNKWESDRIKAQKALQSATTEDERAAAQAEIDRIAKEEKGFEQFNNELKQAGLNQEQIVAAQNQYLTGTINRASSQFAIWGTDMGEMIQKSKDGSLVPGELAQELKTGFQGALDTFGPTTALSPEIASAVGTNNIEMIGRTTQQSETDYRKQAAEAAGNVGANQDGTGVAALDPAQEARNDLTEAERSLKLKVDDLAAQFNPLLGNMGGLKMLAGAAVAAAGVLGLLLAGSAIKSTFSGAKSLAGKVKGLFGKKPDISAAPGAPGGAAPKIPGAGGISAAASGNEKAMQDLQKVSGSSSIEVFLRGVTDGLSAAGKQAGNVVKGAGALAGSITVIGGGIAGATWILGKSLPTLAEGLTAFNKVDGANLKPVGLGMAGLGAGLLAMGGSKVLGAIGNLINFFTEDKDPLETVAIQVLKMQNLSFDEDKVTANSNALVAFSKAMAKVSALGAASGVGNAIKGVTEGITSFFGGDLPYEDFIEFSNLDINVKKTKRNATAFKYFAEALSAYEGNGSSLGAIGAAIAEAATGFFDATPAIDQVVSFSKKNINAAKTKNNAIAFKNFSEAMSAYKGLGSGLGAISTALADATFKFFGIKPPLEQFVYFSNLNINEKKADINSKAFVKFSNAMASYKGGPGLIDTISTLAGAAFGDLFGMDGPIEAFGKFANKDFGPKANSNAEAFLKYAQGVVLARQINAAPTTPSGGGGGGSAAPAASSAPAPAAPAATQQAPAPAKAATASPPAKAATTTPKDKKAKPPAAPAGSGTATVTPESDPDKTGEGTSSEKYTVNGKVVSKKDYDTFMAAHPELAKMRKETASNIDALMGGTGKLTPDVMKMVESNKNVVEDLMKTGMNLNPNIKSLKSGMPAPGMPGGLNIEMPGGLKLPKPGDNVDQLMEVLKTNSNQIQKDLAKSSKMPGNEIKAPLDTNSVLMKLAKTSEEEMKAAHKKSEESKDKMAAASKGGPAQGELNLELYSMLSGKITKMLDILESNNDTTAKRLKHAKA